MSNVKEEKKALKKKPSKKEVKEKEEKKKKSVKGPSSKKSSETPSKKAESPSASREDLHQEPSKDLSKEDVPHPTQVTPGFQFGPGAHGIEGMPRPNQEQLEGMSGYRGTQVPKMIPLRACWQHNQPIKYYCEACEEPTCDDCHNYGPHNSELHRVSSLQDAFNSRCEYLGSGTYKTLLEKRDRLLAQLDKLDYRIGEIRSVAGIIEKDIKTEYGGLLERLHSSEGTKIAVLQHDMASVQKDIERIDTIFDSIDEYLQGEMRGDYIGFLLKFKELHEYIEYSLTKPFKSAIEVVPHDLPRELTERRAAMEKAEQFNNLAKMKDEIIWNLIQEKKKLSKLAELDLSKAVEQEWSEWSKLIDMYSEEIVKYQLICAFCGCILDNINVNSVCPNNPEEDRERAFLAPGLSEKKVTHEDPPAHFIGTGRHFFGKPIKPLLQNSLFQKIISNPSASILFHSITEGDSSKLAKLKARLGEINPKEADEIDPGKFREVLNEIYTFEEEKIGQFTNMLINPITKKVVLKQLLHYLEAAKKEPIVESGLRRDYSKPSNPSKPESLRNAIDLLKQIRKEDLLSQFEALDRAGEGTLSIDCFKTIFKRLRLTEEEIQTLIFNTNPDAKLSDKIDYRQFLRTAY